MLYEEIPVLSRNEIEEYFREATPDVVARALISAALYIDDFQWVQQVCLKYLNGPHAGLRGTALVGLSHLVRLHGRLDQVAMEQLALAEKDPALAGLASDVRDDIEVYITRKRHS